MNLTPKFLHTQLPRVITLALIVAGMTTGCGLFSSSDEAHVKQTAATAGHSAVTETRLRLGDQLQVRLDTGGQVAAQSVQQIEMTIDEKGEISLPLIGQVKAEGMTPGELQERIQANYVPRFYVRCNVTVLVTARFFYVGGEVRGPGRYAWTEDVTMLKAINTAGGFTDYANRRKVDLIRGNKKTPVDFEELRHNPERDVSIQPGDSIWVPRSIF
jgi:polysaccharide export outer membrane protein